MTSWLLDHGANPNARCEVDCTPLSYAVRNARLSVIELMLSRGGDVQKGQLLQYAVSRDEELENVISLLIDRGAPLNATIYQDGPTLMRFAPMSLGTALHIATEQGRTNAMRHLIHLGIDTGVRDANSDTALEWAQKWDKTELVQLLRDLQDRSKTFKISHGTLVFFKVCSQDTFWTFASTVNLVDLIIFKGRLRDEATTCLNAFQNGPFSSCSFPVRVVKHIDCFVR